MGNPFRAPTRAMSREEAMRKKTPVRAPEDPPLIQTFTFQGTGRTPQQNANDINWIKKNHPTMFGRGISGALLEGPNGKQFEKRVNGNKEDFTELKNRKNSLNEDPFWDKIRDIGNYFSDNAGSFTGEQMGKAAGAILGSSSIGGAIGKTLGGFMDKAIAPKPRYPGDTTYNKRQFAKGGSVPKSKIDFFREQFK